MSEKKPRPPGLPTEEQQLRWGKLLLDIGVPTEMVFDNINKQTAAMLDMTPEMRQRYTNALIRLDNLTPDKQQFIVVMFAINQVMFETFCQFETFSQKD